jgi:hypothetical protein
MDTIVDVQKDFIVPNMSVFGAVEMIIIAPMQNLTALQKAIVLNALAPFIVIVATIASITGV